MKDETRNAVPADLPSRRDFILGGSVLGLGAAATGLVGCSEAGQSGGADADAGTMGDRRLFNGLSAETSEVYPFEYKELEINGRRIRPVAARIYDQRGSVGSRARPCGRGRRTLSGRGIARGLRRGNEPTSPTSPTMKWRTSQPPANAANPSAPLKLAV